jgi:hypothetical protein
MAAVAPRKSSDETKQTGIPTPDAIREPHALRPPTVRMAMYFSADGRLHHARCRRPLQFRGIRADIESDFWCSACHEHVALPRYAVTSIPVETDSDRPEASSSSNVVRLMRGDTDKRATG